MTTVTNPLSKKIRKYHNTNIKPKWIDTIYIGTNEINLSQSKRILEQPNKTNYNDCCHIGVAGWYNLDIGWWRKSNYVFIFDINPQQVQFMEHTIRILLTSTSRRDFVDNLIMCLDEVYTKNSESMIFSPNVSSDESYEKINNITPGNSDLRNEVIQILYELTRFGSWLSSDTSYTYIKQLVIADKIVIFCEDIRSVDIFKKISSLLKENHIIIDTIYLSNIYDWLTTNVDKKLYNQSVVAMAGSDTYIIEAEQNINLSQYIMTGKKFISRIDSSLKNI